jgi:hypothetical protein
MRIESSISEVQGLKQWGIADRKWIMVRDPTLKSHPSVFWEPVQDNFYKKTFSDTEVTDLRVF